MSYVNLNNVTNLSNDCFEIEKSGGTMTVTAKKDLLAELTMKGIVFSNIKLEAGSVAHYQEGDAAISIRSLEANSVLRYQAGNAVTTGSPDLLRYQPYFPKEKFVVSLHFFYQSRRLNMLSLQTHKNDGVLRPGLLTRTISVDLNKMAPIMKLLKKARKEGGEFINIKNGFVESYVPEAGYKLIDNKKARQLTFLWSQVKGSPRKMEEEVLKHLGINF